MSFLNSLKEFAKHIGSAVVAALGFATTSGLTDAVVEAAKEQVKLAANSALDNTEKREFVVAKLSGMLHLPESVIRLAVERAVQAVKAETKKI
jgi:hypothetical protein